MGNSSVELFLSVLKNPFIRSVIRVSTWHCPKCDRSHLETALDDYFGNQTGRYHFTRELTSKIIGFALDVGERAFGANKEDLKKAIQVPVFRRGLVSVLRGIAEYGVTKPQRLAAPFLIVWNYTNACNLKCKHCYQSAAQPTIDELSTEARRRVIDQIDEAGVVSVAFSGGEPLMQRDFFEIAKYAADKGLYVSIATNATLISKDTAEKLRVSGIQYAETSLDGSSPETHDVFRGVRGCFEKAVNGIKNLVKAGIYTCIATTVTKKNMYTLPDIVALAKDLGVDRVIAFNFIPTGRGEALSDLDLSPSEREGVLKYLYRELMKGEIEVLSTAPQYSRVCLQQSMLNQEGKFSAAHVAALNLHDQSQTKLVADFVGGCGAGRLYCAIQPNGLVTPCVFMPIVVGDLKKESLQDIWLYSKVLNDLRDREKLKGRCGHCQYKYVCGGCRARAYAYHRDYLMPDPGCIRELEEPSMSSTARSHVLVVKETT